jgi:hypothetical protein
MMFRAVWDNKQQSFIWKEELSMKQINYLRHQAHTYAQCLRTSRAKSADYAGDSDPFRNFRGVEQLGLCSVETGILTRMSDKFSRICNLLGNNRVAHVRDESVEDTLRDLITYSAILLAYLDTKKGTVDPTKRTINRT